MFSLFCHRKLHIIIIIWDQKPFWSEYHWLSLKNCMNSGCKTTHRVLSLWKNETVYYREKSSKWRHPDLSRVWRFSCRNKVAMLSDMLMLHCSRSKKKLAECWWSGTYLAPRHQKPPWWCTLAGLYRACNVGHFFNMHCNSVSAFYFWTENQILYAHIMSNPRYIDIVDY